MGLRELKKEQTRRLIAETAWRLFAERGFDHVKVAEIAREAQVSEATVFNYFRTKEDLFYFRLEAFGAGLLEAVATRPAGQPMLLAFRRYLLESGGLLAQVEAGDSEALERLSTVNRMIAESPALLAREQQIYARYTDALAELLAAEADPEAGDVEPWVAANAMTGVHRALVRHARRRVLEGARDPALSEEIRSHGEQAFALLELGLGSYAEARPD
jgi:AcrR family transcriptional regulator